ncbi:hypothetical protein ScPMuIL_002416 [Solemya velum]
MSNWEQYKMEFRVYCRSDLRPLSQDVLERQNMFCEAVVKKFNKQRVKYLNILKLCGPNIPPGADANALSQTTDEDVALVYKDYQSDFKFKVAKTHRFKIGMIFRWILQIVKFTKASRVISKIRDLPEPTIDAILTEVSKELSIAFEYQLAMLAKKDDVYKLADHVIMIIFLYLKDRQSCFTTKKCLEAVIEIKGNELRSPMAGMARVPTLFSYQWKIDSIFKKPGLRMKITEEQDSDKMYRFYGCFTPWGCSCKPNKYGFRSLIHVFDDEEKRHALLYIDQVSTNSTRNTEIPFWPENIHQTYRPLTQCDHNHSIPEHSNSNI